MTLHDISKGADTKMAEQSRYALIAIFCTVFLATVPLIGFVYFEGGDRQAIQGQLDAAKTADRVTNVRIDELKQDIIARRGETDSRSKEDEGKINAIATDIGAIRNDLTRLYAVLCYNGNDARLVGACSAAPQFPH
jgi:hypothetical protein